MRHSERCEQATKPRCVCSTCGGSQHGWLGHLDRARRGAEGIEELRGPAVDNWWKQRKRFTETGRKNPTKYLKSAGGGVAVVSLVSWVSEDRARIERLNELGKGLQQQVFEKKIHEYAHQARKKETAFDDYGAEMAGHVWCALLAALADVLDRGAVSLDKVPDEARQIIPSEEEERAWGHVRADLSDAALGFLWTCFQSLQWFMSLDPRSMALYLRVLGVLICPDPGGHPRVARSCLRPLVAQTLQDTCGVDLHREWLWPTEE